MRFRFRRSLWVLAPLRSGRVRSWAYAGLALMIFLVAVSTIPLKQHFDFVNNDGRCYYVYLPSLVVDGDLDFSNQMRNHWQGDWHPPLDPQGLDPQTLNIFYAPTGLLKNKYPIGLALTISPAFLTAHGLALALHALTGANWCVPDGYSIPYQVSNLLFMLGLTALGMRLVDRLLVKEFGVNPALAVAAVAIYWLGSPLLYYSFREPYMAHAVGAFWVSATIYLVWRLSQHVSRGELSVVRLTLLAFTTSMALLCRPTNAFVAPFLIWLLIEILRVGLGVRLLVRLPIALLGLAPLGIQLLVWRILYGSWLHYSYEVEGFRWTHPAAWETLFSSRHGLFFWSPLLLAAVAGFFWHVWRSEARTRGLLACCALSFVLLWYCNSCWWCWYFGDSFGARAFIELSGLFVIGLAGAFEAVHRAGPTLRRTFMVALLLALLYHTVLFGLYSFRFIPRADYLLEISARVYPHL